MSRSRMFLVGLTVGVLLVANRRAVAKKVMRATMDATSSLRESAGRSIESLVDIHAEVRDEMKSDRLAGAAGFAGGDHNGHAAAVHDASVSAPE